LALPEPRIAAQPSSGPDNIVVSHDIADVRERIAAYRNETGGSVGLVPTMGCFHEGHLSLMRASAAACGLTVVSIFVNPTQFGPAEDLANYPRSPERDLELAAGAGAGLVFVPADDQMYPPGHVATVDVGDLGDVLCGRSRPGHFNAVATVVAKLLNIIRPDAAWFGQKDSQQVTVIRRMAADLDFSTQIHVGPTVREPDGLAMSSRNCYLTPEEREQAISLYQSLLAARDRVSAGETSAAKLRRLMRKTIAQHFLVELEYARIVHPNDMSEIHEIAGEALGVVAARVGRARLIDNLLLTAAGNGSAAKTATSGLNEEL